MNTIKLFERKKLKLIYRNHAVWSYKFTANIPGTEVEIIKKYCQKMSHAFVDQGYHGWMMISFLFPGGWVTGKMTAYGQPVAIPSGGNYDGIGDKVDHFKKFLVYSLQSSQAPNRGGADPHNDCLYNLLKQVIPELPWHYPSTFKRFLKVPREDMIPLDKMPLIEKKLKIRITVNGDATYQSQYDSKNELHLVLSNNHYTLFVDKKHYTRSSFSDRKILITHEVEDGYRVSHLQKMARPTTIYYSFLV
ncbi:hypothetical protein PAPYR_11557 [Paratrimastix pyriformis]|uniref:Uncharacterized protein n=1 Tax=Paratrimastix pyriformis TaxID=342808 RepID=A0ABQ8U3J4_9EUKA|nr:hypothetical protein PAPYR_11557 [Paratrimastix pyriformis]